MELFRIYSDFLSNIFIFLALDLFVNHFATCIKREKQLPIKITFFFMWILISIIPKFPFDIGYLLDLIYIYLITKTNFFKCIVLFIKYRAYYFVFTLFFAILQTLLTMDLIIFAHNDVYAKYINIIDCFFVYVALCMYVILKKLSIFPTGKTYKRYFLAITGTMILLLVVCSMFLGSEILSHEDVVSLFFSLLLIITLLCISIYRKVVTVLEENLLSKIDAEKNALQQDYATHVEENIKKLSILRHDFKNHLIIIQGYASSDRRDELLEYIQTLTNEFSASTMVNTNSQLLSSIINAKKADCDRANVTFHFQWDFRDIKISDFALVTIVSNLLDNALTAAAKCNNGFIDLQVLENGGYLEIDCVNNHREKIAKKNNNFLTTKNTQPEIHGLGLISVRKTVETLRGELQIDYDEDSFHVNVLVPNFK